MTNWARHERQELCELFSAVGPDAPTLCGAWTTRDLAAHLVVRERRPDAAVGIVAGLGPLRRHTESVQRSMAARPWEELIELVRSGPSRWSPTSVGRATSWPTRWSSSSTTRTSAAGADWRPRPLDPAEDDALAAAAGRLRLLLRRSPVGVRLQRPDGAVLAAHGGPRTVTVVGTPGELVLVAFGRQAHADVRYQGAEADISAVQQASFGI
ncbi:MAG: TIGR03085 family metal-binding protein [Acidimicrobiales bacterium]